MVMQSKYLRINPKGLGLLLSMLLMSQVNISAQEQEGLKVSGYWQLFYQIGQQDAKLTVGEKREGDAKHYARLGTRRGHTKVT